MITLFVIFISLCIAIVVGSVQTAFWGLVLIVCIICAIRNGSPYKVKKPPFSVTGGIPKNYELKEKQYPYKIVDLSDNGKVIDSCDTTENALILVDYYRHEDQYIAHNLMIKKNK